MRYKVRRCDECGKETGHVGRQGVSGNDIGFSLAYEGLYHYDKVKDTVGRECYYWDFCSWECLNVYSRHKAEASHVEKQAAWKVA